MVGLLTKPDEDENDNGQKNYIRSLIIVHVVCRVHTPYKPPSVSDQWCDFDNSQSS